MKMRKSEQAILLMLCDLYRAPEDRVIEHDLVEKANRHGHYWALDSLIELGDDDTTSYMNSTVSILDMWRVVECAIRDFSPEEKEQLTSELGRSIEDLRFKGFDGNNEVQFGIASFLIKDFGRWQMFRDRDLICHWPSIDQHLRMLQEYKRITEGPLGTQLSVEDVIRLLRAREASE